MCDLMRLTNQAHNVHFWSKWPLMLLFHLWHINWSHSLHLVYFWRIFAEFLGSFSGITWHPSYHAHLFHPPPPPMAPSKAQSSSSRAVKAKGKQGRSGHTQATSVQAHVSDNGDPKDLPVASSAKAAQHMQWGHAWTERLIEWLENNPEDWQRLFSNSSHNAKQENWAQHVANGTKLVFHKKIAHYIFSVNPDVDVRRDQDMDPLKYTKAVENQISV